MGKRPKNGCSGLTHVYDPRVHSLPASGKCTQPLTPRFSNPQQNRNFLGTRIASFIIPVGTRMTTLLVLIGLRIGAPHFCSLVFPGPSRSTPLPIRRQGATARE